MTSSFATFTPDLYLAEYYASASTENDALLRFHADCFRGHGPVASMAEIGSGPTVYQLISAAKVARSIEVYDYLKTNLAAIQRWKHGQSTAFSWSSFTWCALKHELGRNPTEFEVEERENLLRLRLHIGGRIDLLTDRPRLPERTFELVGLNFVAESITDDRGAWARSLTAVSQLVAPGGRLIMNALRNCERWRAGNQWFPASNINEADIVAALVKLGFRVDLLQSIVGEGGEAHHGYSRSVCVAATREAGP